MIQGCRFVHCVLVRISPVAVRLQYMGGRQLVLWMREVCGLGQVTTEVDVWRVCLGLEELIVGRHSRHCEDLLLLALLEDSESAWVATPPKAWMRHLG